MTTRFSRIGEGAALAAAALLGGAGLVVNQHADARHGRQLALHGVELVAVMHGQAARPVGVLGVFPRLVGDHDDALGAFGGDLRGDLRHRQPAVIGLAAGHRHRVVEQDLVGHLHAGGDGGADGEIAGVIVGAVAEILEHVIAIGERRLADPVGALAAHLRVAQRLRDPSIAPCSGSRCRHRRGCLPARGSRCCAGSPSRNRGCAARRRRSRRARVAPTFSRATLAAKFVVAAVT